MVQSFVSILHKSSLSALAGQGEAARVALHRLSDNEHGRGRRGAG